MISQQIVVALRRKYEAEIDCARTNVAVYLNHPSGVAEHPDYIETISKEVETLAKWDEQLQMLDKHFS